MKAAVALALLALALPVPAHACSCAPPEPLGEAVENATRVFHGKVVAIEPLNDIRQRVTFQVSEHFKGDPRDTLSITNTHRAMCGYPFLEGSSYIVYAQGEDDSLATSSCSRTTHALNGSELEDLRELSQDD